MTENRTNSPALSRRTLLTALPATGAALALPSVAQAVPIQQRLDELAAEMTALIKSVAPEGCGLVHVTARENWHPHAKAGVSWGAGCEFYRLGKPLPDGRDFWIGDRHLHLNPKTMKWF